MNPHVTDQRCRLEPLDNGPNVLLDRMVRLLHGAIRACPSNRAGVPSRNVRLCAALEVKVIPALQRSMHPHTRMRMRRHTCTTQVCRSRTYTGMQARARADAVNRRLLTACHRSRGKHSSEPRSTAETPPRCRTGCTEPKHLFRSAEAHRSATPSFSQKSRHFAQAIP